MSIFNEFKKFAMRGNVLDLAVAVIIGAAFGKIVSSLVDGVIMPLIGLILGGINITNKTFTIGQAVIKWGMFLQSIIDFTLIAFSIFLFIKIINLLHNNDDILSKPKTEKDLLTEIRNILQKIADNESNKSM